MKKHFTNIILLLPYYPQEPLLFPHIESYKEQNTEIFHDSDTSDKIQNDLYKFYDNSDFDESDFDDETISNDPDDQSIMFDNATYGSVKLDDNHYQISRSKPDSRSL